MCIMLQDGADGTTTASASKPKKRVRILLEGEEPPADEGSVSSGAGSAAAGGIHDIGK